MAGYRRREPLVSYEFGTRIYAPSEGETRYRVVATDADGRRVFHKFSTEEAARRRARELEVRLASSVLLPGRANAPSTVGHLIDRYQLSLVSRSTRYAERQEYLLRMWVRPVLRGARAVGVDAVGFRGGARSCPPDVGGIDGAERRLGHAGDGDVRVQEPVDPSGGRPDVAGSLQPER